MLGLEAVPAIQIEPLLGRREAGLELLADGCRDLKAEEAQPKPVQRFGDAWDGEAVLLDVHR